MLFAANDFALFRNLTTLHQTILAQRGLSFMTEALLNFIGRCAPPLVEDEAVLPRHFIQSEIS